MPLPDADLLAIVTGRGHHTLAFCFIATSRNFQFTLTMNKDSE
jgi:hypothetical protein